MSSSDVGGSRTLKKPSARRNGAQRTSIVGSVNAEGISEAEAEFGLGLACTAARRAATMSGQHCSRRRVQRLHVLQKPCRALEGLKLWKCHSHCSYQSNKHFHGMHTLFTTWTKQARQENLLLFQDAARALPNGAYCNGVTGRLGGPTIAPKRIHQFSSHRSRRTAHILMRWSVSEHACWYKKRDRAQHGFAAVCNLHHPPCSTRQASPAQRFPTCCGVGATTWRREHRWATCAVSSCFCSFWWWMSRPRIFRGCVQGRRAKSIMPREILPWSWAALGRLDGILLFRARR